MKNSFYLGNKWIAQLTKQIKFLHMFYRIVALKVVNFQVKHGQCDSIIFLRTFFFESSIQLLDLCLADSRILYFWQRSIMNLALFLVNTNLVFLFFFWYYIFRSKHSIGLLYDLSCFYLVTNLVSSIIDIVDWLSNFVRHVPNWHYLF